MEYFTNFSDQLVTFDNLTIHHKQGVLKAQYDYYPYGLPWGNVEAAYNETAMTTEFNSNEWGIDGGLDMNFFAARFYDPVLARWHAPDPLEQFHSPYLALCDDPANFIDPDGRAGIPFLQDFMESDLGMFCQWAVTLAAMIGSVDLLSNIGAIGGTIGNVVSGGLSLVAAGNSVKSMAQIASGGSRVSEVKSMSESNTVYSTSGNQQNFAARENSNSEKSDVLYDQLEIFGAPTNGGIWIQYEYRDNSNQFHTDWVNYNNGVLTNVNGTSYQGKPFANNEYNKGSYDYVNAVLSDLNFLRNSGDVVLMEHLADLQSSKFSHIISMPTPLADYNNVTPEGNRTTEINKGVRMGSNCFFDPRKQPRGAPMRKSAAGLVHELLGHSWDIEKGLWDINQTDNGIWMYEVRAVNIENRARALGPADTRRTTYGGKKIDKKFLD